jgi:hypothetical protein
MDNETKISELKEIEDEKVELEEKMVKLLSAFFDDKWNDIKKEVNDLSKKEALREMFISGGMFHKEMADKIIANILIEMQKDPKEFEKFTERFGEIKKGMFKMGKEEEKE